MARRWDSASFSRILAAQFSIGHGQLARQPLNLTLQFMISAGKLGRGLIKKAECLLQFLRTDLFGGFGQGQPRSNDALIIHTGLRIQFVPDMPGIRRC